MAKIDLRTAQRLWKNVGWYGKGFDGIWGPGSRGAVEMAEGANMPYRFKPAVASWNRRIVASVQAALHKLSFEPGPIDGYAGHRTTDAIAAWEYKRENGRTEIVPRDVSATAKGYSDVIPLQADVGVYYGQPGPEVERQLVTLEMPLKFRIDWNLKQRTNKVRVHTKAAETLRLALIAVHKQYGENEWRALGLDRYAGAYNKRRMRGGSRWSMHAYGCAIDFFAQPNGLRTRCPQALFCGLVYKPFLDIMERHEWLPAIRLWGGDAMHFQRARLK